jgi:hypothetical protein
LGRMWKGGGTISYFYLEEVRKIHEISQVRTASSGPSVELVTFGIRGRIPNHTLAKKTRGRGRKRATNFCKTCAKTDRRIPRYSFIRLNHLVPTCRHFIVRLFFLTVISQLSVICEIVRYQSPWHLIKISTADPALITISDHVPK